jgi:hypothetical protein
VSQLVSQRGTLLTPDTAEALQRLELEGAKTPGLKIRYGGVSAPLCTWSGVEVDPGPTGLPSHLSMRPSGREVYLSVELPGTEDPLARLSALWGIAVPLGFMPWNRYPVPGPGDDVFHFMGPWASLVDFLHGEGRGEHSWPSLCSAAQCDVGTWEGPKKTERRLQTQLHRLGIHCGPVDGEIGEVTLTAVRSLGMSGLPSSDAIDALSQLKPPEAISENGEQTGFFVFEGRPLEGFSSGKLHLSRTRTGYSVTARGSGRVVFVVGE